MSTPKCALIVGHSMRSQGATGSIYTQHDPCEYGGHSTNIYTEFLLNLDLAQWIQKGFSKGEVEIVLRDNYKDLPQKIDAVGADFNVSMHFNAFNKKVNGTEVLYYHKSEKSKKIAQIFQDNLLEDLEYPDRGILPRTSEDRGGYILKYTYAPCVLVEPFFIDYEPALRMHVDCIQILKQTYIESIKETITYLGA